MSRRARLKTRHIEEPAVNLTPLIDVVFVILIMFILVAPLLELDQVELANAADSDNSTAVHESGPISIHVHRDSTISFNNQRVTMEQLPMLFVKAKQRYPNARPQVFHDHRGQFGVYQGIKNAAESAGFEQIDVILKPA